MNCVIISNNGKNMVEKKAEIHCNSDNMI